ncbi:TPA: hypothetical protein L7L57_004684 [Klebsiella pneumoniae]|nr:hypothetical protein [Klebsiella pneumoniae]HBQ1755619.1 hypothetical protein [Klebsiella pneumoniae]HBQ1760760.1 hypothetical protein [Klebsiella pneumoniae]HBQ1765864.1 hypothetical protein [Klebsiella pneumoniae]HDT4678867.1 hypothetical protein [Klebsiella pneumoniae subsp. pneumoniae]
MNIKEIGNVFHCDCGFSWHRGKNGNHNCADGLREKVRQLAAENMALKNAITDHSHSVHFCEVCGKDDPCSTDDVCYALKDTPATERIVAAQRSAFVDEAVTKITESGALTFGDCIVALCQLREGADK